MKLSVAVLASVAGAASFPWSACYQNGNPTLCSKSCETNNVGRGIKRELYGDDSWVYKVLGAKTDDAKESYRNVIHFDEKSCTKDVLTTLYQALRRKNVHFELLEKTEGMMKLERAYANFEQTGPDAAEFDSNCGAFKRGLFLQILRDSDARTTFALDIMNKKKTKDYYYLQLQNLSFFDESTDLDSINKCIKSAKVYKIEEAITGGNDMTKCVAYKLCGKTPDWSNEATIAPPATTTRAPTRPPVTNGPPITNDPSITNGPPVTDKPGTDVPPVTNDGNIPEPDSSLPDFNNLDYTFECGPADAGMNPQYQKCTLSTENGWVFHGREKNGVVDFQPIRYGLSPDGANRWKAPRINYEYPDPVDGHMGERITCRQGQNGVEDCLFASIAIKKEYLENKKKVPILYHIHGGGFTGGSGMNIQTKAALHQDVMAIGINYRLGAWGWFYLNEKEDDQKWQGNWGLLDQQAGLKWVHSFAGIFGGDKNMVTLTGGSAGSESCWRHFTIESSWPYFHQMAPVGIGLLTGIKGPHKIQKLTNAFFEKAGCSVNDMECMRALTTEDILTLGNQAGSSMRNDDVAMVLNGAFAPTHRSDLMPDTLFNMVKNRQVRPNTPFLWTYASDETYGMTVDWIKGRSNPGHVLQNVKNDIIADQTSTGFKNPSPYFNDWLQTMFGDELGQEMVEQFGCGPTGSDCHEQIARFTVATQWVCCTRYALERLYGSNNPNGVLYPVEFAEPNCGATKDSKTHACHGADGGWVKASQFTQSDFGEAVGRAYGAFYTTGAIPKDQNYSLMSWADMNYNDINRISSSAWGQFGIRREDCAALDKLQEEFDWYNWGITNGDEDSMVESSF